MRPINDAVPAASRPPAAAGKHTPAPLGSNRNDHNPFGEREGNTPALTRRALTHWQRFQEADTWSRKALAAQLAPAEFAGLEQLEKNLAGLGPVENWFDWENPGSANLRPRRGILTALLSGLRVELSAVPELVRACRPTGAGIAGLHKALQRHVRGGQPTPPPAPVPEIPAHGTPGLPGQAPGDPFEENTEAPAGGCLARTAERVGILLGARITSSEGTGLTEHLAELVDRWGVDLSHRVSVDTLDRLCQETNSKPGLVRTHLERIRKERGIEGKLPASYAAKQPSGLDQHARSVALAVAEALYIEAENTAGDRAALLLEAAALLRGVLK